MRCWWYCSRRSADVDPAAPIVLIGANPSVLFLMLVLHDLAVLTTTKLSVALVEVTKNLPSPILFRVRPVTLTTLRGVEGNCERSG